MVTVRYCIDRLVSNGARVGYLWRGWQLSLHTITRVVVHSMDTVNQSLGSG